MRNESCFEEMDSLSGGDHQSRYTLSQGIASVCYGYLSDWNIRPRKLIRWYVRVNHCQILENQFHLDVFPKSSHGIQNCLGREHSSFAFVDRFCIPFPNLICEYHFVGCLCSHPTIVLRRFMSRSKRQYLTTLSFCTTSSQHAFYKGR